MHDWFIKESTPDKPALLKLLKALEDFPGRDRYRAISNDELEWQTTSKPTQIHIYLSYLEKLGFLRRWYNVPSQLSVRFLRTPTAETKPTDLTQRELLYQLQHEKLKTVLLLCEALERNPKAIMEALAELQADGYIQYRAREDLHLIELLEDSQTLNTLTDEQIEIGDYVRRRERQLDHMIGYALEDTCRLRVIRDYFGEEVGRDYRCGTCDLCQKQMSPDAF